MLEAEVGTRVGAVVVAKGEVGAWVGPSKLTAMLPLPTGVAES